MSAIMALFQHIKVDIGCLDSTQCLLACHGTFIDARKPSGKKMEGCYLYFDVNTGEWIRSGKAIGSNFETRDSEHKKGATSKSRSKTNFYRTYPARDGGGTIANESGRKGYFESLHQYVGIGIDKNCKESQCLTKDMEDGGVFCFDRDTLTWIDKLNYRKDNNRVSIKDKQKDMLGYLWELAYDLCIAPSNNVSESPGFEHPLGVHAGPRTS